ncbi:MAG: hydrogenase, partial [Terriglobia bacterium]
MAPEPIQKSSNLEPAPLIGPGYSYATVTDKISSIVLTQKTPRSWIFGFAVAFFLLMVLMFAVGRLFLYG